MLVNGYTYWDSEEVFQTGSSKMSSWCLNITEGPSDSKKPDPGADPGFFLGGGAFVSCSTSTPINHIVFFLAEYQLY